MNALELAKSGMLTGIDNAAYHASPGVSKSGLDHFARSPAHFMEYVRNGRVETPALRFGRLLHSAVLEPDACMLAVAPQIDRRTKQGKEALENFQAMTDGCEIVTADEAETIQRMRDAVYAHPAARKLLFCDGQAEASGWWYDHDSGELVRFRPDWLPSAWPWIVDLKTAEDAGVAPFAKSMANYRYHVQAALYMDGYKAKTGVAPEAFLFIVAEKSPPYAVAVYAADREDVEIGRAIYQRELLRLAECKIKREWPAYSPAIQNITLPAWAKKQIEEAA